MHLDKKAPLSGRIVRLKKGSQEPASQHAFPEKVAFLQTLLDFHEDIREWHEDIQILKHSFDANVATVAWKMFYDYYRDKLEAHFLFEEKVLFQAIQSLCAENTTYDINPEEKYRLKTMVRDYYQSHRLIRRETARAFQFYKSNRENITPKVHDAIFRMLHKTGELSVKHALDENRRLVPLLESEPMLRFIAGKLFYAYNSEYKERYKNKTLKA